MDSPPENSIVYLDTVHPEASSPLCKVCNRHPETSNATYGCRACNACKMAFRRFIDSGAMEQCRDQNDCMQLSQNDAPRCHACRFAKCLAIGLKPELVRSDDPEGVTRNIANVIGFLNRRNAMMKSQQKRAISDNLDSEIPKTKNDGQKEENGKTNCLDCQVEAEPAKAEEFTTVARKVVNESTFRSNVPAIIKFARSHGFYAKVTSNVRIKLLSHFVMVLIIMNNDYSPLFKAWDGPGAYPVYLLDFPNLLLNNLDSFEFYMLQSICLSNPCLKELPIRDQRIITAERKSHIKALFDYCSWNAKNANHNGLSRYHEIISVVKAVEKNLNFYYANHMGKMIPVSEILIGIYEEIML